jgi:hypothetical protein
MHAVIIQGEATYEMPQNKEIKSLDAGSYFGSTEKAFHTLSNSSENETVIYIRTNGALKIK